jgi:hypothetical protein
VLKITLKREDLMLDLIKKRVRTNVGLEGKKKKGKEIAYKLG